MSKIKGSENISVSEEVKRPSDLKQEVREEPRASAAFGSQQPVKVMSESDSVLADLVSEAPSELPVASITDAKTANLLALPEECEALHGKKYRFRWLANDRRLASKLRTSIWVLCTKLNSPFIKPSRFKAHGAVEQAGMVLAYTSERIARIKEVEPAKKSADLVKHYTQDIQKRDGFYKPESAGEEEDDGGLLEGRDF